MVLEHRRSGSKHKQSNPDQGHKRFLASLFGGKRARARAAPTKERSPTIVYAEMIAEFGRACASEYWISEVARRGAAAYAPNQRCRCQRCLTDNPDRTVSTPEGPVKVRGGRLWPRQAAAVMGDAIAIVRVEFGRAPKVVQAGGCHYECRQIELAPVERSSGAKPWRRRRFRPSDTGWCGEEHGCWRRRGLFNDEAGSVRDVLIRQGRDRDLIGVERTSVVSNAGSNSYVVMDEQVVDPVMLAEVNGIYADGEDSGLIEALGSLDGGSAGVVVGSGKRRGRTGEDMGQRKAGELGKERRRG